MRILIAGGFGFVGGRLAVHLANEGHKIILGSRKAIRPPVWLQQAEIAQINWDDVTSLERSCKEVDVVIHAAGMNSKECATDPVAALTFNGLATKSLVSAAINEGVGRLIYLSTAHVYASLLEGDITEETCPRNLHPYATSHLAGEHAVLNASQRGEIQGIVLRLSNAFGEPVHKDVNCWTLLVNDLCRQAVETRKLVLKTTGLQQRDFVAITKVCRVMEQLVQTNDGAIHTGIFNVGSGLSRSVLGMAYLIQQRCYQIFGFLSELQRTETLQFNQHELLRYRSNRLEKIVVNIDQEEIEEIDKLIGFCQKYYKPTKIT